MLIEEQQRSQFEYELLTEERRHVEGLEQLINVKKEVKSDKKKLAERNFGTFMANARLKMEKIKEVESSKEIHALEEEREETDRQIMRNIESMMEIKAQLEGLL